MPGRWRGPSAPGGAAQVSSTATNRHRADPGQAKPKPESSATYVARVSPVPGRRSGSAPCIDPAPAGLRPIVIADQTAAPNPAAPSQPCGGVQYSILRNENVALRHRFVALRHENVALRNSFVALRHENAALLNEIAAIRHEGATLLSEWVAFRNECPALRHANIALRKKIVAHLSESNAPRHANATGATGCFQWRISTDN